MKEIFKIKRRGRKTFREKITRLGRKIYKTKRS